MPIARIAWMRCWIPLLALSLLGPLPRPAAGQDAGPAALLPAAKLQEDVAVLRRIYETAHPGLYRYNTKAQMDARFDALHDEFARDRSLAEAYLTISRFLATIRCGHSYANFFNQPDETAEALFTGRNRVPFLFRWIDGRMIVTRDLTPGGSLRAGAEILAIDDHPAAEIRSRLLEIARADGGNDAKRAAYLEVRGKDRYEAFDIFLPLFYPATGARMVLDLRAPGAETVARVTVDAQDASSRTELAKADTDSTDAEDADLWRFETLPNGVAYLRMPGWALYNSNWNWRRFLNRGMDELVDRRAPGLIVDLRDNEGGLDVGNVLIERLADREIRAGSSRRYTRYRTLPDDLAPYLSTWDPSFKNWGDKAVPDPSGFFRLKRYDDDSQGDVLRPRGRRFEGRVVVLINAANSSATFQFAKLVKENRLAMLVGQATGGNQRGINGGAFFFATLPSSRIEVDLPLIAYFPADAPLPDGITLPFLDIPDAGIDPDIAIKPSADDIARGLDPEFAAALALFEKTP